MNKATIRNQIFLSGKEKPVSKNISPSQIHSTSMLKNFGGFVVNSQIRKKKSHQPKSYSTSKLEKPKTNFRGSFLHNYSNHSPEPLSDIPEQLLASKAASIFKPISKESQKLLENNLCNSNKPRTIKFEPYNLRSYKRIQKLSSQKLGGLGPSWIGTEEWNQKMNKQRLRRNYSKSIRNLI